MNISAMRSFTFCIVMNISTTEPDELYICVLIRLVSTLTKSGARIGSATKEEKFGGISLSHYA
jgi:hypothetical protein